MKGAIVVRSLTAASISIGMEDGQTNRQIKDHR
jgi:hypothetical protein